MAKRKPSPDRNAKAQRMWRRRQRLGSAVAMVDYQRDAVHSALVNSNQLSPTEIQDRDKIAAALSSVVAEWAAKHSKQFRAQVVSRTIVRRRRDIAAEVEAHA